VATPAEAEYTAQRMPAWMLTRGGEHLPVERLRLRLAAYVYGNILVLAAIVLATGKSIVGGEAALFVVVTALTTYVAHIIAHTVAQQLGREPGGHRAHMDDEMRDALPILISGLVPAIILLAATLDVVPTQAAQLSAALWVVARIALIGFLVERLSGRRPTWRTFSGGLVLALLSAIIVVLKVLFAH
jgi:hypothetical protein